ncbi:MAG: dTMP kinase [Pirellulales bacterium]|nr:dTMP kinase [Pirellulales bacterium]
MFFSFDGIDGTGKSTQMDLFCGWLRSRGLDVIPCRDPGSTRLGERIREIVLHSDPAISIGSRAEMLLYMAARAELVDEVIRPALAAGRTVVADRYLLANIVYQGYAGGLDVEAVRHVGNVATDGLLPDSVFLLDMPPDAARLRLGGDLDRMECRDIHFQERLREGFLKEAARSMGRIAVIDASRSIQAIQAEIRQVAERLLGK